jgi:hypothetical protein
MKDRYDERIIIFRDNATQLEQQLSAAAKEHADAIERVRVVYIYHTRQLSQHTRGTDL